MRFFILLILFFLNQKIILAQKFQSSYGGVNSDLAVSVSVLRDETIVSLSTSNSYSLSNDFLLSKVDNKGAILWSRIYGGTLDETAVHLEATADGGYILLGNTLSFGNGNEDIYVIKTDSIGNLLWSRAYGGFNGDFGGCIKEVSDGGYIIAGRTQSFGEGSDDGYLVRIDSNGNLLWCKSYGTINNERFYYIENTSDRGYIISGIQKNFSNYFDQLVIKVDNNGDILFSKNFGDASGFGNDAGDCIKETKDGGYILSGQYRSFGSGGEDLGLTKIDNQGNLEWAKVFGNNGNDRAFDFLIDQSGNYILAGYTSSFGLGGFDAFLVKLDQIGSPIWYKTFGYNLDDFFSEVEICETGYIMVGYTNSFGLGAQDIFTVKTDFDGLENINCSNLNVIEMNIFPIQTDISQIIHIGGFSSNASTITESIAIDKTDFLKINLPGLDSIYFQGSQEISFEAIPSIGMFKVDGIAALNFIPSNIGTHLVEYEVAPGCIYSYKKTIFVIDICQYSLAGLFSFSSNLLSNNILDNIDICIKDSTSDFFDINSINNFNSFEFNCNPNNKLFFKPNLNKYFSSYHLMKYRNGFDTYQMENIVTNRTDAPLQIEPSAFMMVAADVDISDKIRSNDISLLQQRIVNKINGFPQQIPVELNQDYLDWRFIDGKTVNQAESFKKGSHYPYYSPQGYCRDNVPDIPFLLTNQGSCDTTYQETYSAIFLGDLVDGGTGIAMEGFNDHISAITFDIDDIHALDDNTYRVFMNHTLNEKDKFVSFDFTLDYDESVLSILNTQMTVEDKHAAPQYMYNNYNSEELLFTSYSASSYPLNGSLLYIDIHKPSGLPTVEDLGQLHVFANGMEVPSSIRSKSQTSTGIEAANDISSFINLYPNPTDERLTISLPLSYAKDVHIEFLNLIGQSVLVFDNRQVVSSVELDLSTLPAGMYECLISVKDKTTVMKKVVVK